jgi:cAMP phosphodiesterase
MVREHVSTYLITHPHLDHLSGFAINTAAFHNTSRPKRLAALPFTVNAIKNNIFNDVIWPNLTDEDNGVGFVTFQRLADGGNLALGDGDSRGYIEVCDGLSTKGFKVSHGMCASKPAQPAALPDPHARRSSLPGHEGSWNSLAGHHNGIGSPGKLLDTPSSRSSVYTQGQSPTPTTDVLAQQASAQGIVSEHPRARCVVDSSAFFIRAANEAAPGLGKEILVWGDVEPDSISVLPRNHIVWADAAPKIVSGTLKAVFIECSYSDVQGDAFLFGHLAPRHVVQELMNLADMVSKERRRDSLSLNASFESQRIGLRDGEREKDRKRKRMSLGTAGPSAPVGVRTAMQAVDEEVGNGVAVAHATAASGVSGKSRRRAGNLLEQTGSKPNSVRDGHHGNGIDPLPTPMDTDSLPSPALVSPPQILGPLHGFTVVIIHVKDTLCDGPLVGDLILADLQEHEAALAAQGRPLGCEFVISKRGESYVF